MLTFIYTPNMNPTCTLPNGSTKCTAEPLKKGHVGNNNINIIINSAFVFCREIVRRPLSNSSSI